MEQFVAAFWGIAIFIGPILLGAALLFGTIQWRRRRRDLARDGMTPRTEPRSGAMASKDR
ncbi:MAG: hypothetical protein ACK4QW_06635 [Alphaproteobacteria bacterium]